MAEDVHTEVVQERGQWTVFLLVVTEAGVERRRLETYRTQRAAELAADLIRRTTARRRNPGG